MAQPVQYKPMAEGSQYLLALDNNGNALGTVSPSGVYTPFGSGGSGGGFTYAAEVPGGLQNGSNKTFTLAHTPSSVNALMILYNGQFLTVAGGDLTLTGNQFTLTNYAPNSGSTPPDTFFAYYS